MQYLITYSSEISRKLYDFIIKNTVLLKIFTFYFFRKFKSVRPEMLFLDSTVQFVSSILNPPPPPPPQITHNPWELWNSGKRAHYSLVSIYEWKQFQLLHNITITLRTKSSRISSRHAHCTEKRERLCRTWSRQSKNLDNYA